MASTNEKIILKGKNDILCGKVLLVCGKKFNRVKGKGKERGFIKIIGSVSCEIKTPITDATEIYKIRFAEENKGYNIKYETKWCFKKERMLFCEPEEDSNCPDYKGGAKKHHHKRYGHVPDVDYKVGCGRFLCAVGYVLVDERQARKPFIGLKNYELVDKQYTVI